MKTRGRIWLLYFMAFVLLNAAILVIPFEKTASVIVAWAGLIIMCLIGAVALYTAMGKRSEEAEAFLIGQKLLKTALTLIGVQLVVLVAVALLSSLVPFWAVLVAEVFLLIIFIMILIKTDIARATVRKVEHEAAAATADMKALRAKAEALCAGVSDPENAKALRTLADELRYADPVSDKATASYEKRLDTLLESIRNQDDPAERAELIRRATALVKDHAAVAKANK